MSKVVKLHCTAIPEQNLFQDTFLSNGVTVTKVYKVLYIWLDVWQVFFCSQQLVLKQFAKENPKENIGTPKYFSNSVYKIIKLIAL